MSGNIDICYIYVRKYRYLLHLCPEISVSVTFISGNIVSCYICIQKCIYPLHLCPEISVFAIIKSKNIGIFGFYVPVIQYPN